MSDLITKDQAESLRFQQHEKKGNHYITECGNVWLSLYFHRNVPIYLEAMDSMEGHEDNSLNLLHQKDCTFQNVERICKALSLED